MHKKRRHLVNALTRYVLLIACGLLAAGTPRPAWAQGNSDGSQKPTPVVASDFTDDPEDPENKLAQIEDRNRQRTGLFEVQPLGFFRNAFRAGSDKLYERSHLRFGLAFHHVFQWADPVLTGTDNYATATDFDMIGNWEMFNRGQPHQGELYFNLEGRWDYGTIGPQNIGFASLGSAGGTANSFSAYTPTFLMRQLYFRQGSAEAGWAYRIGKITVDGALTSSRHINPNATFLPNVGTGMFSNAPPDSGLGIMGTVGFSPSWSLLGVFSDANADRQDFGDIGAGDFYKALELQWKTPKEAARAGGAKVTVYHSDGTEDGLPINGSTGEAGAGFAFIFEHELSDSGRPVIVARYGQSFDGAAIYDAQAGLHFLLYQPAGPLRFGNDVFGAAINWVDSAAPGARDEYNFETFYRFPLFPHVDTTLSYQYVRDPALTTQIDGSSVFSIRLTTSF